MIAPDIISEALIGLGESDDEDSHAARLILLIACLSSSSNIIRYGAMAGIGNLRDTRALPYVKRALERETIKMLRDMLGQVIKYLDEACTSDLVNDTVPTRPVDNLKVNVKVSNVN